jgi:hypothetical protein
MEKYNMEKGTDKKIRKWKVGNCLGMIGVNADLVQSERWAAKWPVVERWVGDWSSKNGGENPTRLG